MKSIDALADETAKLVLQKFDAGLHGDIKKVIKEALLRLEYEFRLEALRQALQPGIEQADRGEYSTYSYEELMADVDKMS